MLHGSPPRVTTITAITGISSKSVRVAWFLAGMLVVAMATTSGASSAQDVDVEYAIGGLLARDAASRPVPAQQELIERFYRDRKDAPAWTHERRPTHQAVEAIALLERAAEKGLSSTDYDAPQLSRGMLVLRAEPRTASPDVVAGFDIALTRAVIRYTSHLAHGRVDPRSLGVDLDGTRRYVDVVGLVQRGLDGDQLTAEIESAEPRLRLYGALKSSLAGYRLLAADGSLPVVPLASKKVAPGEPFAGLPQLRQRLMALGDLDPDTPRRGSGIRYEGDVVKAVKRFQYRHGLPEDGVLGAATIAELNRSLAERVQQLEIGIERIRWLPSLPAGRFLVVNIPEFQLAAFDGAAGSDSALLEMDVIVGRAGKSPTPVFAAQLEYVEFSPYWNVPHSIAVKELLPKLRKDPGYLAREGMEMVGGPVRTESGEVALAEIERGTVRLRQRPGPRNALGGVKFVLPNRHDVYLHSTPSRQLFSRPRRDFSHGCIRVAAPVTLAEFVLIDRSDWGTDRIRESMNLPQPLRVTARPSIPVLIFYATAVVDGEGRTRFLPDIYEEDPKVLRALARPPPAAF
jgi:murein L,D-transpeptidase YcbB/YkuD